MLDLKKIEYYIYVNGKYVKSVFGLKKALRHAEKYTDRLFNERFVEVINPRTGEVHDI